MKFLKIPVSRTSNSRINFQVGRLAPVRKIPAFLSGCCMAVIEFVTNNKDVQNSLNPSQIIMDLLQCALCLTETLFYNNVLDNLVTSYVWWKFKYLHWCENCKDKGKDGTCRSFLPWWTRIAQEKKFVQITHLFEVKKTFTIFSEWYSSRNIY